MPKGTSNSQLGLDKYIDMLEDWFKKLPPLPASAKDWIVKLAPWLALIFGVLGVLGGIAATGLLTVLSPFIALGGGLGVATGGIVGAVLAIVASALMIVAFPGLRDHKAQGWQMAFYSEVVSVVSSVVALNLVGAVISALIGFYILFQVKSYYK